MTYTPTPWSVTDRDYLVAGLDTVADRHLIAECYGTSPANKQANAEFIATAVNSHAQMVEALRVNLVEQQRASIALGVTWDTPGMTLARVALAAAGEEV